MLTVVSSVDSRAGGVLKRDSTEFRNTGGEHGDLFTGSYHEVADNNQNTTTLPFMYLDSPSTTSSTTYYLGTEQNSSDTYFNRGRGGSPAVSAFSSSITLLEIGA